MADDTTAELSPYEYCEYPNELASGTYVPMAQRPVTERRAEWVRLGGADFEPAPTKGGTPKRWTRDNPYTPSQREEAARVLRITITKTRDRHV